MLALLCSPWGFLGRPATAFREHDFQNEPQYVPWVPVLLVSMVLVGKRKETTAGSWVKGERSPKSNI